MTDALVAFLRARYEEEAEGARVAGGTPWDASVPNMVHVSASAQRENRGLRGQGYVASVESAEHQRHIARHDPARVLADVAAKRSLVDDLCTDEHGMSTYSSKFHCGAAQDEHGNRLGPDDFARRRYPCDCGRDDRVYRRIRLLALPYAHHQDYREEWRP